ncbi:YsnF/AvaK domain-containing protein [Falsirhodobacter sp. 20TX0035]|uniref:YsnF/AvaK domain-containing protein n=1 Tax=Falsirhodobacter sp. 20TX0035 TaxID=3022019 RepID=UPI00232C552A|nr:YsnF/AvaK domain-containing protein [Falsirhodobacter sp. 20TX0035]MDB6452585.1 YsnF/AvaK domain-containing protein [Falsirhodobacter sp. 20TX0035]
MTYNSDIGTSGAISISALFDNRADADAAVARLNQAGVSSSQIRMEGGNDTTTTTTTTTSGTHEDKGFWDKLGDYFFPDEDRYTYAEGLSRGGYLVTVTGITGAEYDTVLDILDDEGTVNLDEREASWRSEGWGGYESSAYAAPVARPMTTPGASTSADIDRTDDDVIPVVEERLRVGKRDTQHGRVRVRAYTVEEPVSETVDLREEHVELERRPVDRAVTAADAFTDRTLEAEEYREEAVVSKDARVVEEVGLRKTSDTHRETISDTVRHTEVEIEDDRTDRPGFDTTKR